jgi:D-3-phosphoglycerate dehydrogenase
MKTTLVIDFDSTFVQVESLDELARIALRSAKDGRERLRQIEALTAAGMEGKIEFGESLAQRLGLFGARQEHIDEVVRLLKGKVTPSVARHRDWIREHAQQIYVISGGFHECIEPVVAEFGIATEHVLANPWRSGGRVRGRQLLGAKRRQDQAAASTEFRRAGDHGRRWLERLPHAP